MSVFVRDAESLSPKVRKKGYTVYNVDFGKQKVESLPNNSTYHCNKL